MDYILHSAPIPAHRPESHRKRIPPYGLALDKQGNLFVADGRANKVLLLDAKGKVAVSWGEKGSAPGQFQFPHVLAADAQGNLIVGEIKGKRFQLLIRGK